VARTRPVRTLRGLLAHLVRDDVPEAYKPPKKKNARKSKIKREGILQGKGSTARATTALAPRHTPRTHLGG